MQIETPTSQTAASLSKAQIFGLHDALWLSDNARPAHQALTALLASGGGTPTERRRARQLTGQFQRSEAEVLKRLLAHVTPVIKGVVRRFRASTKSLDDYKELKAQANLIAVKAIRSWLTWDDRSLKSWVRYKLDRDLVSWFQHSSTRPAGSQSIPPKKTHLYVDQRNRLKHRWEWGADGLPVKVCKPVKPQRGAYLPAFSLQQSNDNDSLEGAGTSEDFAATSVYKDEKPAAKENYEREQEGLDNELVQPAIARMRNLEEARLLEYLLDPAHEYDFERPEKSPGVIPAYAKARRVSVDTVQRQLDRAKVNLAATLRRMAMRRLGD